MSDVKIVKATVDNSGSRYANTLPTIDVKQGGQWGFLPVVGGIENGNSIESYLHEAKYMRRDLIAVTLTVPKFMDYLPNPESWKAATKAMLDVHAKTIDGLNTSLVAEKSEADLGLSGAKFAEYIKTTRESSSVSITLEEKVGLPWETLFDVWIRYGIGDPDTTNNTPLINRLLKDEDVPEVYSPNWKTMSAVFIEPDELMRKPVHVFLTLNMGPNGNPDILGKKDKAGSREFKTITQELGGFTIPGTNRRVWALGVRVLNNLELWKKDPEDLLLPVDTVDPTLETIDGVNIYYDGIKPGTDSDAEGNNVSATADTTTTV